MKELVSIKNNQVVVDSRSVAKNFNKEHRNVVRDIENLVRKHVRKIAPMFQQVWRNDNE